MSNIELDKNEEIKKQIEILKQIRKIIGMNRTQFSEYMGIPRRTLEDWESGRRKAPEYVLRLINYKIKMEHFMRKQGIDSEKLDQIHESEINEI